METTTTTTTDTVYNSIGEEEAVITTTTTKPKPFLEQRRVQLSGFLSLVFALVATFFLMKRTGKKTFWWVVLFWLIGAAFGNRLGYFVGTLAWKDQ